MKQTLFILSLIICTNLFGQTNINIDSLGINQIDEKGNKQGLWKLYKNDSLVMSCTYTDNIVKDTITYYHNSSVVMHYVPKSEKSLWFFYASDTISGYTGRDEKDRFTYYYSNGSSVEKNQLSKLTSVSEFRSAYYGGSSKMQKDLLKNYDNSISSGRYKVSFVINQNGEVTNIKVVESSNKKMNKKIKGLVNDLERWQPAHQSGKMVRMSYTIPLSF